MAAEPVDVLIVGAGASGGVVARRLAEAGFTVTCLEQGDWHDRPEYRGAELDWELTSPQAVVGQPQRARARPMTIPSTTPTRTISPLMFAGVGGSMLLFAGAWPRLLPSDFRVRTPRRHRRRLAAHLRRAPAATTSARDRQIGVSGLGGDPAYPPAARTRRCRRCRSATAG